LVQGGPTGTGTPEQPEKRHTAATVLRPPGRGELTPVEFKEEDGEVNAGMIRTRAKARVEVSEQGLEVEKVEDAGDETDAVIVGKTGVEGEPVGVVAIPKGFAETQGAGLAARGVAG
jgi:hypothetical protein